MKLRFSPSRCPNLWRRTIRTASVTRVANLSTAESLRGKTKAELLALCDEVAPFGTRASVEQHDAIKEKIMELASCTPNPSPCTTRADLFNGVHDSVYSTNPGSSGGRFGPLTAAAVYQTIVNFPSSLVNTAVVVPGLLRADLQADFDILSEDQVRVNFRSATLSLFGGLLKSTKQFGVPNAAGTWKILYVDEDLRLLRANKGSLFVIKRRSSTSDRNPV